MTSMAADDNGAVTGPRLTVQFSSERPALEGIACECYAAIRRRIDEAFCSSDPLSDPTGAFSQWPPWDPSM
jgi:hypothetical protein